MLPSFSCTCGLQYQCMYIVDLCLFCDAALPLLSCLPSVASRRFDMTFATKLVIVVYCDQVVNLGKDKIRFAHDALMFVL